MEEKDKDVMIKYIIHDVHSTHEFKQNIEIANLKKNVKRLAISQLLLVIAVFVEKNDILKKIKDLTTEKKGE